jgi:RHH-type rel operon transcriptional repressor/antitoxin RelB
MLAIRLSPDIENRLERLAKKTGRTKTFYVREAIFLAVQRLKEPAKTYSASEVKRSLGLNSKTAKS